MPVPCPCCRALNDAGPNCRRCKADLALLFQLERNRAENLANACKSAVEGRFPDAEAYLARVRQVRVGDEIPRFQAAFALLARDFPAAKTAYDALSPATGRS